MDQLTILPISAGSPATQPQSLATSATESLRHSSYSSRRASGKLANVSDFASDPLISSENALLIKVLRGMRQSPISFKDFQDYLDAERSGELSKFFVEAEKHTIRASEREPQAVKLACDIAEHYIRTNADEEINISEQDRNNILEKLQENQEEAGLDPSLFKDAKSEVIQMLSGDKFQRFLKKQLETNINEGEVRRRMVSGIVLILLSVVLVGILMWVQTFAQAPFNVRWWRLIVFPILFWGIALIISSRLHVCSGLAGKCVRMRENDNSWFAAFRKDPGTQEVQDELALTGIINKVKQINRESIIYSLAAIVVIILLPPGYGVLVEG